MESEIINWIVNQSPTIALLAAYAVWMNQRYNKLENRYFELQKKYEEVLPKVGEIGAVEKIIAHLESFEDRVIDMLNENRN